MLELSTFFLTYEFSSLHGFASKPPCLAKSARLRGHFPAVRRGSPRPGTTAKDGTQMSNMLRALDEREERLERLRWMHPFADDDEIEHWYEYILDPLDLGPISPLFANQPFDDALSAGIEGCAARSEAFKRAAYKCENCGVSINNAKLDPHHRHYRCEGEEIPSDYLVLCRECHYKEHWKFGRYVRDLFEEEQRLNPPNPSEDTWWQDVKLPYLLGKDD